MSTSAKPAARYSTIAFPNSTFFAFWVPLTLPKAFPEQRGIDFCKADWLPGELNMFIFSLHITISILPVKHPFTVCLFKCQRTFAYVPFPHICCCKLSSHTDFLPQAFHRGQKSPGSCGEILARMEVSTTWSIHRRQKQLFA